MGIHPSIHYDTFTKRGEKQMNVQIYDFNDNLIVVPWFQLLQWKYAISLEMQGLKHSRGSVTAHVRRKLNAPSRYAQQDIYNHIAACVDDLKAQLDGTEELNLQPMEDQTMQTEQ
jgi:hypothetical protein